MDLGARTEDTREATEFFKKITEVREALRGVEGGRDPLGPDEVMPVQGVDDR